MEDCRSNDIEGDQAAKRPDEVVALKQTVCVSGVLGFSLHSLPLLVQLDLVDQANLVDKSRIWFLL